MLKYIFMLSPRKGVTMSLKKNTSEPTPKTVLSVAKKSKPKTTRPEAPSRREESDERSVEEKLGRTLDAFPDKIDLEDWPYQPTLRALPSELINIPFVPAILDQGTEGACTGFALAAVVNYLHRQQKSDRLVSPRMLYELARRYDEWPGEAYVGSSARGAMKAWVRHGACTQTLWPDEVQGAKNFSKIRAQDAVLSPGGAFYRVNFRQTRHLHAALNEVGIVYATLMVHTGWASPGPQTVNCVSSVTGQAINLPVIQRNGKADAGHAIAIIGYTDQGFVIQNSWGLGWGTGGFALLPYEDFMMHATDVWVAQLGVPVKADLWAQGAADTSSGTFRAGEVISLADIRPYVIDVGNNGELSDRGNYWTTPDDLDRLFSETIPTTTKNWKKHRVMLYVHGGLNSENDAAKRIIAYRDVCLANEIYPLHVMWESDWITSTRNILEDQFNVANERAGGAFLDHLREARDRILELTVASPGGKLWSEMKQNARLASDSATGAMSLLSKAVQVAKEKMDAASKRDWELHIVAHSAGSILSSHAAPVLAGLGIPWKSIQFMAPAIRIDAFKKLMQQLIISGKLPKPTLYILSKVGELDDDVGPYGKSLLYLVSNALEGEREVPILGMQKFLEEEPDLFNLLNRKINGLPGIVVSGQSDQPGASSKSDTHGGFDNDPNTLNSVLIRILGNLPKRPFTERDLQF
jgi:hypothetical protein